MGDRLGSKTIAGLNFSRSGLWGDPVAFQATFTDGSQGVYTVDVTAPLPELRITGAEAVGNDMRLSFTSATGRSYVIQSRADAAAGEWLAIPGDPIAGTGATVRVTIPNAFTQRQGFYRARQAP